MAIYGNILNHNTGCRRNARTEPVEGVEFRQSQTGYTLALQFGQNLATDTFPSTPTHKPVIECGASARSYGKRDDKGNPV